MDGRHEQNWVPTDDNEFHQKAVIIYKDSGKESPEISDTKTFTAS